MNDYIIYRFIFPDGKMYIGQTNQNPEHRWRNGEGYYNQKRVYKAILNFGWDNIKKEILFTNLTKIEANILEKTIISEYNTTNELFGYNVTSGGSGEKNLNIYSDIPYDYADIKEILYHAYKSIPGKSGNVRSLLTFLLFSILEKESITIKEMCDYCNYSSESRYRESLEQLEKLGYITWNRYQNIVLHPQKIINKQ